MAVMGLTHFVKDMKHKLFGQVHDAFLACEAHLNVQLCELQAGIYGHPSH